MKKILHILSLRLRSVITEWREELWGIPVAVLLFFISPFVLRWLDPTAGTYDAGVLQVIVFAAIMMLIFNGMAWMGIKQVFPEVFEYFQKGFKEDFNSTEITKWQRLKISVCLYLALLLALVALARVI